MRLQNGIAPSNGRVEVCQNRIWGSVCTDQWDHTDASVVCRQLGHDSNGTFEVLLFSINSERLDVIFSLSDGIATDIFGPGDEDIVFLSEVQCTGLEANLILCPHTGVGQHMCTQENSAGVICEKRSKDKLQLHTMLLEKISTSVLECTDTY